MPPARHAIQEEVFPRGRTRSGQGSHSSLRARIAILWSKASWQAKIRLAARAGATYRFTGADGSTRTWLRGEYAYLAPNALDAVLNRYNLKHDFVDEEGLREDLDQYDMVFLPGAEALDCSLIEALAGWLAGQRRFLIVSGPTNLPPELLGLKRLAVVQPEGYTAWHWTTGPFCDTSLWETYYISSYEGYRTCLAESGPPGRVLARQLTVSGDLAAREKATTLDAGAGIVATDRTLFVANQVFEYLGGAFQAHINIEAVRQWSNVTHWAETLLYQFRWVLKVAGPRWPWETRLRVFGSHAGAFSLRHDTDASSDTTMLDYEAEHLVPATWLLIDSQFSSDGPDPATTRDWVGTIAKYQFLEAGLHNDSLTGSPPTWISGPNLLRHVKQSERNLGIRIYSCGRHGGYSIYPEMIDAMGYLFEHLPQVLGLGTFCFHYMVEYGAVAPGLVIDDRPLTYATALNPTIATPGFWFPFHAAVATVESARPLRGWDMTHEYDVSPVFADHLFTRVNSKDGDPNSGLEDPVIQFQYHSLFTADPSYNGGLGTLPWLAYVIDQAEQRNLWLASQKMIYERMQDYQDIRFRTDRDGNRIEIHNPTDRTISGLMFERVGGLPAVRCGPHYLAHVVDRRYCTIPPLQPRERQELVLESVAKPHPTIRQPSSKGLHIIDCRFDTRRKTLLVQTNCIRHQSLLSEGWAPGAELLVIRDDAEPVVRHADSAGCLAMTLLGPPNHFAAHTLSVLPVGESS